MRRGYTVAVERGDIYQCKARRGYVRVKVTHVFSAGPWVTVVRVDEDGEVLRGRQTTGPLEGCRRGEPFDVYLTNQGDGTSVMRMPRGYERIH